MGCIQTVLKTQLSRMLLSLTSIPLLLTMFGWGTTTTTKKTRLNRLRGCKMFFSWGPRVSPDTAGCGLQTNKQKDTLLLQK